MEEPFHYYLYIQAVFTLILLLVSALISGSEVAFFSLNPTDVSELKKSKEKRSQTLVKVLEKPKDLLANVLILNNVVNILIVLLMGSVGSNIWGASQYAFWIEMSISVFLILIFGEVLPKVYATKNPKKFALSTLQFILICSKTMFWIRIPLVWISNIIEKHLTKRKTKFSVEDLSQAFELTDKEATTDEQKNILEGIVTFGATETVQIMKPRIDIGAISIEEDFSKVLEFIIETGFSRNPIYKENLDEIVGVLYAKDLLPYLNKRNFHWQKLIRAPFFVPENRKLDDLLLDFQEKKNHLAIVVDEYGGTSGLVTLEDVIEEIVGDISDEFDDLEIYYTKIDDHNYEFEGKTHLKDFCKVLNVQESIFEEHKGESETLAGFILEISGRFPRKFERINFKEYRFTIKSVEKNRLKKIKVTLPS